MMSTSPAHSYHLYILRGSDGTFYTGIARNVEERVKQHNGLKKGGAKFTTTRRPWKLVYTEQYATRSEALKREYEIKGMTREQKTLLVL